jgi:2'-deoxynucleoside 5'-phosphate N-hydrolase
MSWRPNIYYAAAIISANAESIRVAKITVDILKNVGAVLTEHICLDNVLEWEAENVRKGVNICNRDLAWLNECDVVVADISQGSIGVGVEVMYNLTALHRPTLVLHKIGKGSRMITQLQHPLLTIRAYNDEVDIEKILIDYFANFKPGHKLYENLIVFDAIDGAGKGVVHEAVKEWARERKVPLCDAISLSVHSDHIPEWEDVKQAFPDCKILLVAEPAFAWIGKIIRAELIQKGSSYSAFATAHAYSLDRDILYKRLVIPALKDGVVVVSDRGVITSEVYQPVQAETYNGYSREFFLGCVRGMPGNQQELHHAPGMLLLLQVPVEVAMGRLTARMKDDHCLFEDLRFQQKVAAVYAGKELRNWYRRKGTEVIDVEVPPQESREQTKHKVRELWTEYAKKLDI